MVNSFSTVLYNPVYAKFWKHSLMFKKIVSTHYNFWTIENYYLVKKLYPLKKCPHSINGT